MPPASRLPQTQGRQVGGHPDNLRRNGAGKVCSGEVTVRQGVANHYPSNRGYNNIGPSRSNGVPLPSLDGREPGMIDDHALERDEGIIPERAFMSCSPQTKVSMGRPASSCHSSCSCPGQRHSWVCESLQRTLEAWPWQTAVGCSRRRSCSDPEDWDVSRGVKIAKLDLGCCVDPLRWLETSGVATETGCNVPYRPTNLPATHSSWDTRAITIAIAITTDTSAITRRNVPTMRRLDFAIATSLLLPFAIESLWILLSSQIPSSDFRAVLVDAPFRWICLCIYIHFLHLHPLSSFFVVVLVVSGPVDRVPFHDGLMDNTVQVVILMMKRITPSTA